ncbi:hypothetical protein H5410_011538 [Solanum commersonii]|uniref:Uncharacterized protein n=1 Tax=Solanum commersonii TaxID=4109 RepID=A0A9J6ANU4_SOLCO|nr:hypothetical protein H5410_011538 [Solanum commersonii]
MELTFETKGLLVAFLSLICYFQHHTLCNYVLAKVQKSPLKTFSDDILGFVAISVAAKSCVVRASRILIPIN